MGGRLRVEVPLPGLWDLRVDGVAYPVDAWVPARGPASVELRVRAPLPAGTATGTLACDVNVPDGAEVVVALPDAVHSLLPLGARSGRSASQPAERRGEL